MKILQNFLFLLSSISKRSQKPRISKNCSTNKKVCGKGLNQDWIGSCYSGPLQPASGNHPRRTYLFLYPQSSPHTSCSVFTSSMLSISLVTFTLSNVSFTLAAFRQIRRQRGSAQVEHLGALSLLLCQRQRLPKRRQQKQQSWRITI